MVTHSHKISTLVMIFKSCRVARCARLLLLCEIFLVVSVVAADVGILCDMTSHCL